MIPSSLGITRSGSRQKLAKNAASINIKTPRVGATRKVDQQTNLPK